MELFFLPKRRKEMASAFGLAPKGMIKRNAVALIVALYLIFRDDDDNDEDKDDLRTTTTTDRKKKIVDGKVLQLICLTTRVIRIGGMLDDTVIAVTKCLFEEFVAHSPEHMKIHHEQMLAKDNEAFFT